MIKLCGLKFFKIKSFNSTAFILSPNNNVPMYRIIAYKKGKPRPFSENYLVETKFISGVIFFSNLRDAFHYVMEDINIKFNSHYEKTLTENTYG